MVGGRRATPASRTLAAVVGLAGALLLGAPQAQAAAGGALGSAAGSCWAGPRVTDHTNHSYSTSVCPTWTTADLTDGPSADPGDSAVVGRLWAGNNWVVCQMWGRPNPSLGGGANHYWLYTQGDVAYRNGGWGWLPATAVSYGGDDEPIPGVEFCARS
ncbi:hypothetical protein EF912_25390 [Streptomyces sp. WAC07061]|uniref:hypothetical protein n=1 Tax=Streptomyces sp. WAC07061 TaxID=2487410 RepID=UPI000F77FE79|nr:hypothetical protein [Streptomyces sp. WAC07061]RSS48313.1 hypothetical protein EF912_25390 [Streptomyces sp. WAC07061]